MKVPIIITSNGVPDRLKTSMLLDNIPHTVVFDNQKKADACKGILGRKAKIELTNRSGLVTMRNHILSMVPKGQWFIGMDDNIIAFTAVKKSFRRKDSLPTNDKSRNWRHVYNELCSPDNYIAMIKAEIFHAIKINSPLVGVATMENPFFRSNHFAYRRFVKTKMFAMCNTGDLDFKFEQCHDSYLSALAVAKYGTVLVSNYLHYKSKMYEGGGLGSLERRKERGLEEQLAKIVKKFPGLVDRGIGPNTALRFLLRSDDSVTRWRETNGYV